MSSVSRSVYQRLKEENKRLLKDIYILVEEVHISKIFPKLKVIAKWRKKFKEDEKLNSLIKEACLKYLEEHPELDIAKKIKEKKHGI